MEEQLILVDRHDLAIGTEAKLRTHQLGLLHRAFSIYVLNSQSQMLLQRRAFGKYHSGGLWSNTCCGHPRPDEDTRAAAQRRLLEEMGFHCELRTLCHIVYKAEVGNGLIEHEYLHVYAGRYEGEVSLNAEEASGYAWVELEALRRELQQHPEKFTLWFRIVLPEVLGYFKTT